MTSFSDKTCLPVERAAASSRLQPEDIHQILEVVRALALRYSISPTNSPPVAGLRGDVRGFVQRLEHNPCLTLRVLIFALEDVGHRALQETTGCEGSRGGDLC